MDIRIENAYHTYGGVNFPKQANKKIQFSDVYKKAEENYDLGTPVKAGFRPKSSEQVMAAWDKTLTETGIDPFPMNKLSTALIIHVESGRQESSSAFLGDSVASAESMAEQIVKRLENPLSPGEITDFSRDEMFFYKRFLENLRLLAP